MRSNLIASSPEAEAASCVSNLGIYGGGNENAEGGLQLWCNIGLPELQAALMAEMQFKL